MTDSDYALLIVTDGYVIQREGSRQELEDVVAKSIEDGFYRDAGENGEMIRYTLMSRIKFFDILTKEQLDKNMKMMEEQRRAYEEQQKQMAAQQQGGGGNIIQIPGRGM